MGLVGAAVVSMTLPSREKREKAIRSTFDISGAVLSFLAVFLMLVALNRASQLGWESPVIRGCLVASVILWVLFFVNEKRSMAPLVDLRLFENYRWFGGFLVGALMYAVMSGNAILMPFYLEMIQGMTPQIAGTIFLVYSLTRVVTSPFAGKTAASVPRARLLVTAALLTGLCAYFFLGSGCRYREICMLSFFSCSGGFRQVCFLPRTVI